MHTKTADKAHHKRIRHEPAYKQAFVSMALPVAQQVSRRWGVPVSVLLAQAVLESAWGRAAPGNAYFGIKGHSPTGNSVKEDTHEENNGVRTSETDAFRAYTSFADAADDYGRFLNNPRFKAAHLFPTDPEKFTTELVRAHYGTDSKYKTKIMEVINGNHFTQYDH